MSKKLPISARAICKFPGANAAGMQVNPVNRKVRTQMGFLPILSMNARQNKYDGISIRAVKTPDTKTLSPIVTVIIDRA